MEKTVKEILMMAWCTEKEAESRIEKGVWIYTDVEDFLSNRTLELFDDEEEMNAYHAEMRRAFNEFDRRSKVIGDGIELIKDNDDDTITYLIEYCL